MEWSGLVLFPSDSGGIKTDEGFYYQHLLHKWVAGDGTGTGEVGPAGPAGPAGLNQDLYLQMASQVCFALRDCY